MTRTEKIGLIACMIIVMLAICINWFYNWYEQKLAYENSELLQVEFVERARADSLDKLHNEDVGKKNNKIAKKKSNVKDKARKSKGMPRNFLDEKID